MRFRISDAFLPGPEELLEPPSADSIAEGTVVDFSDSGSRSRYFAVVEVLTRRRVVVPVDKLRPAPENE